MLGYRSGHFPSDPVTVAELKAGRYDLSILKRYDALSDVPIPAIFAQLDAAWPGSKFVLTVRDPDSWLESCRNAPFNRADQIPEAGSTREFYRVLLYGTVAFQADRFAWVYETHVRNVIEHFAGEKSGQLLVLDVVGGEGWEKLCPFLGVPQPDAPFPHDNPRSKPTDSGAPKRNPGPRRDKQRGISSILRRGR